MLSLLAVGSDERLLDTRSAVLRLTPAQVTQARPDKAVEILQTRRFDLVVLCHSVSRSESVEVAKLARLQAPSIHVLQIVPGDSAVIPAAEVWADGIADSHPGRLIAKVRELVLSAPVSPASYPQQNSL